MSVPHVQPTPTSPRRRLARTVQHLSTAIVAGAILAAPSVAAAFPRSGIVTPSRFGELRSGMAPARVSALWGAPRSISHSPANPFSSFAYGRGRQRIVVAFSNRRLDDVVTRGPSWKLRGIGPGSSWSSLQMALPTAECSWDGMDAFSEGCLYVRGDFGTNSHAHRVYFAGPKSGPIRSIHLITNHAE